MNELSHRNKSVAHASTAFDVVLTHNAIAVLQTFAALETADIVHSRVEHVDWIVWVKNVEASSGAVLGVSVW